MHPRFSRRDDPAALGYAAYERKDYPAAARHFEAAAAAPDARPGLLYDAACACALAGRKAVALDFLERAIRGGYRDAAHLASDTDLDALHADPRWPKLTAACAAALARYERDRRDPRKARFVTEDIDRFLRAYDAAMAEPESERARVLARAYLNGATVGAQEFAASGRLSAAVLAARLKAYPRFWAALRAGSLDPSRHLKTTRDAFVRLKRLLPEAVFPDVTFVVGQLSSGGTSAESGLLIGAEMFTRGPATPMDELNRWLKGALMEPSEIPALVTHEAIHFQQKYPDRDRTLLRGAIQEGSADFLGEAASGKLIRRMAETHRWANAREKSLWDEFQAQMDGTDLSRWLYKEQPDRPVDLGYWMGYKICEAYLANASDKRAAYTQMVRIDDFQAFLARSGYARKFG